MFELVELCVSTGRFCCSEIRLLVVGVLLLQEGISPAAHSVSGRRKVPKHIGCVVGDMMKASSRAMRKVA